jgi:peptidyl-prolyl cis-trans isomerase B (cyclophilin B)
MKKISVFVLGVLLIAGLFSGCAPQTATETTQALTTETMTETSVSGEGTVNADGIHPVVMVTMASGGQMVLELYPEVAPNTVNNFLSLAQKGYYNGLIFHRVIEGFMIQGGDPTGTGMGGPGYGIMGEFSSNGFKNELKHQRGVISMARSKDKDSAGSQFFIMHQESSQLDGDYSGFGMLIEGLDVLDVLATAKTDQGDRPLEELRIKEITVDLKGYAFSEPVVIQ